ncbi:hypothetical protein TWF788_011403 [Orbilia oligospora]|uniref:Uncharacterized protein n=1 Tax=Orbilia oligospora TaxID=2813651 RepID=A0A7C8P9L7_ORBOL|nr:hypothetical protein TWF788_011403 [Orbilia oligospora]
MDHMKNVMYVPNCAYSIQVPGTTYEDSIEILLEHRGKIPSQDSADLVQARIEKPVVFHAQAHAAQKTSFGGFLPPVPKNPGNLDCNREACQNIRHRLVFQ